MMMTISTLHADDADDDDDDDDFYLAASSDTFLSTLIARNTRPTFRTFLLV